MHAQYTLVSKLHSMRYRGKGSAWVFERELSATLCGYYTKEGKARNLSTGFGNQYSIYGASAEWQTRRCTAFAVVLTSNRRIRYR